SALYRGRGSEAYDRIVACWPALKRSLLLRVQAVRVLAFEHRARCAVATAAARPSDAERLLRDASHHAAELEQQGLVWATAQAHSIRGAVALVRGERAGAAASFIDGAQRFDEVGMALYAAAARRQAGRLMGGDEGRLLVEAADERFAQQGVV